MDLLNSLSMEELTRRQQELRLQSIRQLQMLKVRQSNYINSRNNDINSVVGDSALKSTKQGHTFAFDRSFVEREKNGDVGLQDSRLKQGRSYHDQIHGYRPLHSERIDIGENESDILINGAFEPTSSAREKLIHHSRKAGKSPHNNSSHKSYSHSTGVSNTCTDIIANTGLAAPRDSYPTVRSPVHQPVDHTVAAADNSRISVVPGIYNQSEKEKRDYLNSDIRRQFSDSIGDSFRHNTSETASPDRSVMSNEGTPKSILRHRQLIDRNVRVDSKYEHTPTSLSSRSHKRGLNYSYTDVDSAEFTSHRTKSVNFEVDQKGDRSPAGRVSATSGKPAADQGKTGDRLSSDTLYFDTSAQSSHRTNKQLTSEDCAPAHLLLHAGNDRKNAHIVNSLNRRSKSSACSDGQQPVIDMQVNGSYNVDESQSYSKLLADRNRKDPLLGYDWIAGLVDNEKGVTNIPDDCFESVQEFRRLNRDACVGSFDTLRSYDIGRPITPEVDNPSHTCIHGYTVNDRLFTEPDNVDGRGQSVCPVCLATRKETTIESPGFVRVSISQKVLSDQYRVKPHRRRSFDATDSCALSQHCLAGWECSRPSNIPTASALDLKHAINGVKSQMTTTEAEVQKASLGFSRRSRLLQTQSIDLAKEMMAKEPDDDTYSSRKKLTKDRTAHR